MLLDVKVKLVKLASLGSKVYQAGKEMMERQEILETRVQMDNQDHRVRLVSLET